MPLRKYRKMAITWHSAQTDAMTDPANISALRFDYDNIVFGGCQSLGGFEWTRSLACI